MRLALVGRDRLREHGLIHVNHDLVAIGRGADVVVAVMSTYAVSGFYAVAVNEQAPAGKTSLTPPSK
jgi:hypothetical protein